MRSDAIAEGVKALRASLGLCSIEVWYQCDQQRNEPWHEGLGSWTGDLMPVKELRAWLKAHPEQAGTGRIVQLHGSRNGADCETIEIKL